MRRPFLIASLLAGLAPGLAVAQEPGPKLPATPSMDQKGSDDLSKPAGAAKPAPTPTAPKAAPSGGAKAKPPEAKAPEPKAPAAKGPASKHTAAKGRPSAPHASGKPHAKGGHAKAKTRRGR